MPKNSSDSNNYFDEEYFEGKFKKSSYLNYNIFKSRLFWRDKIKFIKKIKGKLLDVGCAYGFFLKHVNSNGVETYGLDISKVAVKKASKFCKKISIQSACNICFKDNVFNCITAFDVLEHLENPQEFLSEVYRVLKPGGILILQTPNPLILGRVIPDRDKTHVNKMREKKLIKLIKETGFRPKEVYGNFYFFSIKRLRKIAPNILILAEKNTQSSI